MISSNPLFSIILPVFNGEKTIERTIQGVLEQSYSDWELIILDSESTDSTQEIIEKHLTDHRIKYFREKDKGIYDGMNKGIDKSQGDWLYFTGCDDYFFDNTILEKITSVALNDDLIQVIYGKVIFQGSRLPYDRDFDLYRLSYKNICHQAIFYNKSLFQKHGYYNLKYPILSDWDFNLKWISNDSSVFIDETIAYYNETGLSGSTVDSLFKNDLPIIVKRQVKKLNILKRISFYRKKYFSK